MMPKTTRNVRWERTRNSGDIREGKEWKEARREGGLEVKKRQTWAQTPISAGRPSVRPSRKDGTLLHAAPTS